MGVKKFGFESVKNKAKKTTEISNAKIIRRLSYIGEKLCEHARNITPGRSSGGYDDQTGNLRSSIGYRIYKDGEPVRNGGFKNMNGGSGKNEAKKALDGYESINFIPNNGWTMVIVAGMSYARYVESKGFNVLRLTKSELRKEFEKLRNQLK